MRYTYTDEDIEFLKIHYPNGDWDEIQSRFPSCTKEAIYKKCRKLGIASNNTHRISFDNSKARKKWSEKELDIVRENYTKLPLDDLMKLLPNRNKNMVINAARRLGLTSYNRDAMLWKTEDVDYIKQNWELTPDKVIAERLGRSFRAVKAKREELGLYRCDMDSNSYPTLGKYLRGQNQKWKKGLYEIL